MTVCRLFAIPTSICHAWTARADCGADGLNFIIAIRLYWLSIFKHAIVGEDILILTCSPGSTVTSASQKALL